MANVSAIDVVVEERLKPGTRVEVRSRFEDRWSRGFEVAEVLPDGYRLLRLSDLTVLPAVFGEGDVRRQRKQGLWWA
ncbi:MAG TPA: hypothetical protein VM938_02160 [Acidimicrobiales bacterium]|nr:hypothetical protein [Acidimicrobiales bacterium]